MTGVVRDDLERFPVDVARRLREEAHGMARAYANAILSELARETVVGIYAKGSAYGAWDSVIDYVPELSDVDVHVRLHEAAGEVTLERALDVGTRAVATFGALFPEPEHVPRVRVIPVSALESEPGYRPSPDGSVHTLHGRPYEGADRTAYAATGRDDARRFLADADFVANELPLKVIDRPGRRAWGAVSRLSRRVAPAGPRLLTRAGHDPFDAWSLNRTAVVRALLERGYPELARSYAEYYRAGWDGFRSGFSDVRAARRALLAADRLFRLGRRRLLEAEEPAPKRPSAPG